MLTPVAYSELVMPSLRLARSSRLARALGKVLFVVLVLALVLVMFAPWQQSISGQGDVVAYAPLERQQTIEAPIKGRIMRWGEGIFENARVAKGQVIVEIQDLDPMLRGRLQDQLISTRQQVEAAQSHLAASERNLEATTAILASYESQIAAYTEVKQQVLASADAFIENARQKVIAEEQHLIEQQAAFSQAEADYQRQKQLYEEKIASQLKFQEAERKHKEAVAKVAKTQAYVQAAKDEVTAKERDRDAKAQKAQVDIDYAIAIFGKAKADVAKVESEVAKSKSELSKAQKELSEMETKVSRQDSQVVVSPMDGFILQIAPNQGGKMLSEGDTLCVIVPETEDRAVQLWLKGNDAPLVEPGRHVRLQFEGWPAVQFAGWPSVAIGTFGGEVISVDSTDDGKGKFRILIRPNEADREWPGADWPDGRFLRQGVRANGWVILNRVPMWFEVWRRMNAFPPVVSFDREAPTKKPSKPPKVGKSP
ncbi:MAG: toxin secretion protein [Planctomycetaceae bacterium]|nr:toxin secretion protein [Planctomycetaceae bacterium]